MDLLRIDDFSARKDPDLAAAVGRAALAAGDFLAGCPQAGATLEDSERKWSVPQTGYALIHQVPNGGVEIAGMYRGREDWRRIR